MFTIARRKEVRRLHSEKRCPKTCSLLVDKIKKEMRAECCGESFPWWSVGLVRVGPRAGVGPEARCTYLLGGVAPHASPHLPQHANNCEHCGRQSASMSRECECASAHYILYSIVSYSPQFVARGPLHGAHLTRQGWVSENQKLKYVWRLGY